MVGGGGDVDVDAGPEFGGEAFEGVAGAFGLAVDVFGGEAGDGDLFEIALVIVVEYAIVEVEEFLLGDVGEVGCAYAVDVVGDALAGAVVVDDNFLEVGVGRHLGEILFGAIDGVEGVVMPDVPAYAER